MLARHRRVELKTAEPALRGPRREYPWPLPEVTPTGVIAMPAVDLTQTVKDRRLLARVAFAYLFTSRSVTCRRVANESSIPDAQHAGILR
jgi:hypothetical protein